MVPRKLTAESTAEQIRRALKSGGSHERAVCVQWFFKEEIKSHGWYTAALRKAAVQSRRSIAREHGMDFVVRVADTLFTGRNLEEKTFAVLMLEKQTDDLGEDEFKIFASWLDRVTSWADHDALVHYLIGPILAADATLLPRPLRWAVEEPVAPARGRRQPDPQHPPAQKL